MSLEQSNIPKGWNEKHVSDIIEIEYGKGLTKNKRKTSGKYPVYGSNGIVGYYDECLIDYPSIIIGRKGSAGALNMTDSSFWATDVTYFVKRKDQEIPLKLILYLLQHLKLSQLTQTGPKPGLNRNDVYKLKFFFPPKKIHKKIIEKLDYFFAQLERKRNQFMLLKRITNPTKSGRPRKGIKQFDPLFSDLIYSSKQSILDFAINGNFTVDWRKKYPNIESGMSLLNKIQNDRKDKVKILQKLNKNKKKYNWENFEIKELKKHPQIPSWAIAKLENLIYIAGRIGWKGLSTREYTKEGPLFLSVHSLNYGNEVDFNQAFHISQKRYDESPEIQLKENDILLAKDGNIGKIGIVKNLIHDATVNSSLLVIRNQEAFIPKFLFYLLSGSTIQKLARERTERVTVPHLYQRDIKNFTLPIPPISEQVEIVRILDFKLELILKSLKKLEFVNNLTIDTLEQLETLKTSILDMTFSGKLVN
jgi:type I restriction enzyme, S subunit